uniref:Uncharacterized protein n=1 Tax=Steinernema glaseri TaxID=37863 RepID=A0A1I7YF37_9BILA
MHAHAGFITNTNDEHQGPPIQIESTIFIGHRAKTTRRRRLYMRVNMVAMTTLQISGMEKSENSMESV